MFRREWRQQILVLALLTVAVAAAIGSVTIAYNSGAADDAEFGSASHLLRFDGANPRAARGGTRRRQEVVRDDRGDRPPLDRCPRQRRHRGVPRAGPARHLRRARCSRSATAATRRVPARSRSPTASPSLLGSRSGTRWPSMAVAGPSSASSRTRAIWGRVRPCLPRVRRRAGHVTLLVDADAESIDRLHAISRPARSSLAGSARSGASATASGRARWRCSRWPPSSCSWPRSSPPPVLPSSRSDDSASSACSPRPARPEAPATRAADERRRRRRRSAR